MKNLIKNLKTGFVGLSLIGASYFNADAQTTSNYEKDYGTENFQNNIYQQKEDSILESILKEFLPKYKTDTISLEYFDHIDENNNFIYKDTIKVLMAPINYLKYNPLHSEKDNQIHIWGAKEMAKWLQSLGKYKRESLGVSFLKEKEKIGWTDLEYARQELDPNYPPDKPVNIPGTDLYYFISTWLLTREESTIPGTDWVFATEWTFTKEEMEKQEYKEIISIEREGNKINVKKNKKEKRTIFLGE